MNIAAWLSAIGGGAVIAASMRLASLFPGTHYAASVAMLSTGLVAAGVGARLVGAAPRRLWAMECVATAAAALLLAASRWTGLAEQLYLPFAALEVLVACVAVAAIGLPLVSRPILYGLAAGPSTAGRRHGLPLALSAGGAAIGILVTEFLFLPRGGLDAALGAAVILNAAAAVVALVLRKSLPEALDPAVTAHHRPPYPLLLTTTVTGTILVVVATRILYALLGPWPTTRALLLAAALAAAAAGMVVVLLNRKSAPYVLILGLLTTTLVIFYFDPIVETYVALAGSGSAARLPLIQFALALALVAGPAAGCGAALTATIRNDVGIAEIAHRLAATLCATIALVYIGYVATAYAALGHGQGLLLGASGLLATFLFFAWERRALVIAAALVYLAGAVGHRYNWDESLLYYGHAAFRSEAALAAGRESTIIGRPGRQRGDNLAIVERAGEVFTVSNGRRGPAVTSPEDAVVGALAVAVAPDTTAALVIGSGSGVTVDTIGQAVRRTVVVEPHRVVAANGPALTDYIGYRLAATNVVMVADDPGRRLARDDQTYDLILLSSVAPTVGGNETAMTPGFLRAVRRRLTPAGVFLARIDGRVGDAALRHALAALKTQFAHCWVAVTGTDSALLISSDQPPALRDERPSRSAETFAAQMLAGFGVAPGALRYAIVSTDGYAWLLRGVPVAANSSARPALEQAIRSAPAPSLAEFSSFLVDTYSPSWLQRDAFAGRPINMIERAALFFQIAPQSDITDYFIRVGKEASDKFADGFRQYVLWQCERAVELADNADTRIRFGEALLYFGEAQAAAEQLATVVANYPRRRDRVYLPLGLAQFQRQSYEEAEDAFRRAIAASPRSPEPRYWLGRTLAALGRHADAARAFAASAATGPGHAAAGLHLGIARLQLGDAKAARAALADALTRGPENPMTMFWLAKAHLALDEADSAATLLRQCLAVAPTYANARLHLGEIHEARGDAEGAIDHYLAELAAAPESRAARDRLFPLLDGYSLTAPHGGIVQPLGDDLRGEITFDSKHGSLVLYALAADRDDARSLQGAEVRAIARLPSSDERYADDELRLALEPLPLPDEADGACSRFIVTDAALVGSNRFELAVTVTRGDRRDAATYTVLPAALPPMYHCPMQCEGTRMYPDTGACPVCEMDLAAAGDAHGDHEEKHGGQFFMAPDNWHHVEGAMPTTNEFRLYLYNNFTKELSARALLNDGTTVDVSRTRWGQRDDDPPPVRLPFELAKDETYLAVKIPPELRFPLRLDVHIRFPGREQADLFEFEFVRVSHTHPDEEKAAH